jgi:protein-S-isoprenylcysteine O-methyltransferase Ste14
VPVPDLGWLLALHGLFYAVFIPRAVQRWGLLGGSTLQPAARAGDTGKTESAGDAGSSGNTGTLVNSGSLRKTGRRASAGNTAILGSAESAGAGGDARKTGGAGDAGSSRNTGTIVNSGSLRNTGRRASAGNTAILGSAEITGSSEITGSGGSAGGAAGSGRAAWPPLAFHALAMSFLYFGILHRARPATVVAPQPAAGAVVIVAAAGLAAWTLAVFHSWRLQARIDGAHELCTAGPFRRVRNPIYLAMDLLAVGSWLWVPTAAVALAAVLVAVGGDWRGRAEERVLHAVFGATYDRYCRQVRRFVPGVY